jgi:hypothetical protein
VPVSFKPMIFHYFILCFSNDTKPSSARGFRVAVVLILYSTAPAQGPMGTCQAHVRS